MNNIIEKVELFLKKHDLLKNSRTFIVAFSGGWDSMCLLDILSKLQSKYHFKLIAAHLNHNWRGEESTIEEENCKKFAAKLGAGFISKTLDSSVRQNETAAREERYKFLENCANDFDNSVVLTAHNFDDNAETILYRIVKGTGIIGLEGIREKRGIFYRPLINAKRFEIEYYCQNNNLIPNDDSSNDNTKYARNFIRHKVISQLKEINSNILDSVNSLSELARNDNEIINEYLYLVKKQIIDNNFIDTGKFIQLSNPIKSRIVYEIFIENKLEYDREKINNILEFIEENSGSKSGKTCSLTTNLWLFVSDKSIEVVSKQKKENFSIKIKKTGRYETPDYIFELEKYENKIYEYPDDSMNIAYVDLSNFKIDFTLRTRQEGDFITPLGMKGSQKIKKYLNAKKIPNHKKDNLVFLCKDNEVLWAGSLGLSDKIKVVNTPTHVLRLIRK